MSEINFLSEDLNPDETTKDEIKRLLTEFNRLGSLYYSNGDEKPVGSKDRRVAESIIAWKKERNNQDVLTYDNVSKRKQWQIQKNEIDEEYNKILKRKNASDISMSMRAFSDLQDDNLAEENEKITKEFEEAKKVRDQWYEENTRTEISPEFYREQEAITDSINAILSRYPSLDAEDLTEAYKRLNNAILGFRDNDGAIQGNDVVNAGNLFQTVKDIEAEIEDIKKYAEARELSADDKSELGRLYKMLNALQGRKETQYYKDKVAEVQATIRTEVSQDQEFMDSLEEKAKTRRETYIAAQIASQNAGGSSGASIYAAIADGIADSYGVMRFTPNRLMVAPSGGQNGIDFAGLLGAVADGRPLFAAAAPQNANGLITQGSTNGTVAGLDLVVSPNYTGDDANTKYALVYPSAAMRFHESGTIELRANIVANGRIEIGLYGYVAVVNRYPTAFRQLTVA